MKDYFLYNKNRLARYVFKKSQGVWKLSYGVLAEDIKEACIDALFMRFDNDMPEILYHQGKRQVVEVSAKKIRPLAYLSQPRLCWEYYL
ncbi:hypothetical protein [Sphingobacterium multivorum]|uniref:hypothetical protein n=1 Tax=Sphingobacterium multivorum TaxID=28454 RepID=UPI00345EDF06